MSEKSKKVQKKAEKVAESQEKHSNYFWNGVEQRKISINHKWKWI